MWKDLAGDLEREDLAPIPASELVAEREAVKDKAGLRGPVVASYVLVRSELTEADDGRSVDEDD